MRAGARTVAAALLLVACRKTSLKTADAGASVGGDDPPTSTTKIWSQPGLPQRCPDTTMNDFDVDARAVGDDIVIRVVAARAPPDFHFVADGQPKVQVSPRRVVAHVADRAVMLRVQAACEGSPVEVTVAQRWTDDRTNAFPMVLLR